MKLYFEMSLKDERGIVHGKIVRELPEEAAFIGTRCVDELKSGFLMGGMTEAVQMMRVREFRKEVLKSEGARCATLLAEHLEDREGWHGIDRPRARE